jgi:hypothetical protein
MARVENHETEILKISQLGGESLAGHMSEPTFFLEAEKALSIQRLEASMSYEVHDVKWRSESGIAQGTQAIDKGHLYIFVLTGRLQASFFALGA